MDVTPVIPVGKNVIKGYGNMTFKVNDTEHSSSLIVFPESLINWKVSSYKDISIETLKDVFSCNELEILLVGCGDVHMPLSPDINLEFRKIGVGVEIMTTGAACRTYNVLLAEGRNVAAALVLV